MFLVVEGVDGTGKSTQVARVAARLRERGREVVETFEPGATAVGAAMRDVLLDSSSELAPLAEALLLTADRAQHVAEVVRPALERGADVVSDRYVPSSLAYQGVARALGIDTVDALNRVATGGLDADLVVVLDLPGELAAARREGSDRLEAEDAAFHDAVRRGYLGLAAGRSWIVIDGTAEPEAVADEIMAAVDAVLASDQGPGR